MAAKSQTKEPEGASGLERLRGELTGYLGARARSVTNKLSDGVSGLTDELHNAAENGGTLSRIGSRVLGGESPVKSMVAEKASSVKDAAVGKVKEAVGGGGKGEKKPGDTKVTNIVETIDIGVPLRTCYDNWTQFEEFSGFMKGVTHVSRKDETTSDWKLKVGPSSRSWEATVEEQVPDERIVWTSEGSKGSTRGAVSFHELGPSLTRIVVVVEYYPAGFFEKTGNLWRAQGRRLRLDLKHFQRYVTLGSEEAEGWRGEIRDSEVVRSHDEAVENENENEDSDDEDEDDTGEDEEGDSEENDEDDDEEEDDDEDEEAEDEEDDEEEEEEE